MDGKCYQLQRVGSIRTRSKILASDSSLQLCAGEARFGLRVGQVRVKQLGRIFFEVLSGEGQLIHARPRQGMRLDAGLMDTMAPLAWPYSVKAEVQVEETSCCSFFFFFFLIQDSLILLSVT